MNKKIKKITNFMANVFTPIIPILAGSGMLSVILTLINGSHFMSQESTIYLILSSAANVCFYFLPIFLTISLSKQLKVNVYIAVAIVLALFEPSMLELLNGEQEYIVLGIDINYGNYSATVFPSMLSIITYAYVEKILTRFIPESVKSIIIPLCSIIIMVPLTIVLIGPCMIQLGNILSELLMMLFHYNGALSGIMIGGLYPLMAIIGLHWVFTPIIIQNLTLYGGDVFGGVSVCSVYAILGVTIGYFLSTKKTNVIPLMVSGILSGVIEPILYTLILKHKKLLLISCIASGIGGGINGWLCVKLDAYVFHNIFSLMMQAYTPFIGCLVGVVVSLSLGIILTYYYLKRDKMTVVI